jgi:hypothetical protein
MAMSEKNSWPRLGETNGHRHFFFASSSDVVESAAIMLFDVRAGLNRLGAGLL